MTMRSRKRRRKRCKRMSRLRVTHPRGKTRNKTHVRRALKLLTSVKIKKTSNLRKQISQLPVKRRKRK